MRGQNSREPDVITPGQVIGIIIATAGVIATLIAMTTPDFGRLLAGSYRRLMVALTGLVLLVFGIWAVPYFADRPKSFVESGREIIGKGRDTVSEKLDTFRWNEWWPWRKTEPPHKK